MDLTTLSGDDTIGRVKRLCAKAKKPISTTLTDKLGLNSKVGAVCVYHDMIETAVSKLQAPEFQLQQFQQVFLQGYHLSA